MTLMSGLLTFSSARDSGTARLQRGNKEGEGAPHKWVFIHARDSGIARLREGRGGTRGEQRLRILAVPGAGRILAGSSLIRCHTATPLPSIHPGRQCAARTAHPSLSPSPLHPPARPAAPHTAAACVPSTQHHIARHTQHAQRQRAPPSRPPS